MLPLSHMPPAGCLMENERQQGTNWTKARLLLHAMAGGAAGAGPNGPPPSGTSSSSNDNDNVCLCRMQCRSSVRRSWEKWAHNWLAASFLIFIARQ